MVDQESLITRIRALVYAVRHGQWEKVLAGATVLLFTAGGLFRTEFPNLGLWSYSLFALGLITLTWLVATVWRKAAPAPTISDDRPLPNAIKGLCPFIVSDGALFARLGRRTDLTRLLALVQDDQVGISVVRGESGVGKTSLLRAGLEYRLGKNSCVYWEANPTNAEAALLHAIRTQIPDCSNLADLQSLPDVCRQRYVLILDQFEQLHRDTAEHLPVFSLLERIGNAPAPHNLSAVVAFRREYTADWLDFEQGQRWHAEQVPLSLFAEYTARDGLVTLCSEAGFTLDNALATNFVRSVTRATGVSPLDLAIGVLSLANFAERRGATHLGLEEYKLSGGAEGLLMSYVQQKFNDLSEVIRAPLLKGIVLALVDFSNNQRIAEGASTTTIAEKAEVHEDSIAPSLVRLAHPRIRLLEEAGADRYRLAQDRLVPVLCRLAGRELASDDQLRLTFEAECTNWVRTHNSRHLLRGKELRAVLRQKDQLTAGDSAGVKTGYLAACLSRRRILQMAFAGAGVAAAGSVYGVFLGSDWMKARQSLKDWNLPPELFSVQDALDGLEITRCNDFGWLRSQRLSSLAVGSFSGTRLDELAGLKRLKSLSLQLRENRASRLGSLERLNNLTALSIDCDGSSIDDLSSVEPLTGLQSLHLTAGESLVRLPDFTRLTSLKSLSLSLLKSSSIGELDRLGSLSGVSSMSLEPGNIESLPSLDSLKSLRSLSFRGWISSLQGIDKLPDLATLKLNMEAVPSAELGDLKQLKNLKHLSLGLKTSKALTSLEGLKQLPDLESLHLNLVNNKSIADLSPLTSLSHLNHLGLELTYSKVSSLKALKNVPKLTSLTVSGYALEGDYQFADLTNLKSLSIVDSPEISSVYDLMSLKGLESLTLEGNIESLDGLERLSGLKHLSLGMRHSLISEDDLKLLKKLNLESLSLDLRATPIKSLDVLENFKSSMNSLTLRLADDFTRTSSVDNLLCLDRLELKSAVLWLPVTLVAHCAQLKMRPESLMAGCRV